MDDRTPRGQGGLQRTRILVIDDEPGLGRVMAGMLAREHEVTAFTCAQDALDLITAGARFDLILCDLSMSPINGVEFYDQLGVTVPELTDRIVFTTGGAFTASTDAFLKRPSVRWIGKPFPPVDEFRQIVREHLARLNPRE
jgi:CheY-like chemotaxis protein